MPYFSIQSPTSGNATQLQGRTVSATGPTGGQVLTWDGSAWAPLPGVTGPTGSAGVDGPQIYSGTTGPFVGLGRSGDWYIDITAGVLYGPKASNAWGSGLLLQSGPQGPTGPSGVGATGPTGAGGTGPTGSVGATGASVTGPTGAASTVTGPTGATGSTLTLSDATPSALGTASAGTSSTVSRADHTHQLPAIAYANLTGTPLNFPTNTALVSGLSAGYSGINHAHNYVTSLNNLTGALTLAAGANVTLTANGSTLTLSSVGGGIGLNDAVDGGDYIGEILAPSISISSQPANTTAYLTSTIQNLAVATANVSVGQDIISDGSRLLSFTTSSPSVRSSTDGTAWSSLYGFSNTTLGECIASVGNTVVASAHSYATQTTTYQNGAAITTPYRLVEIYTSDDGGSTWSQRHSGGPSALGGGGRRTLAYGSGRFVAMTSDTSGPESSTIQTFYSSSDGVSWTGRSVPCLLGQYYSGLNFPIRYCSLAYGGGKFVAVAKREGPSQTAWPVATSTDGISWTATNTSISGIARSSGVAYGNGRFVSIPGSSAAVSTDGTNWVPFSLPSGVAYDGSIAFTDGLFIAFGEGVDAAVSSDGQTWAYREMPLASSWRQSASVANTVVIVSDGGTSVITGTVGPSGTTSATLSVSASVTSGVASYQWQLSSDAGATWANISGATSSTLSLTGLTTADSGKRYRVSVSATGAATVTSNAAILTVS